MVGIIVDIVVVVLVLLLIIFGTWRGMYKIVFGLVTGLLAILLAVLLTGKATSLVVEKTELETYLRSAIDSPLQGALPAELDASNVTITYNEDGTLEVIHNGENPQTYTSVSAYVEQTESSLSAIAGLLDTLTQNENAVKMIQTEDEASQPTLADLLCATATAYILIVAMFFILWMVLYILLRVLMFFVKKIVTRTHVGYFLDKVLGFAIGTAVAMLIVWGALAVIRLLGTYTWIISVNAVIDSSVLTKVLYQNNFLYTFLVDTVNFQETIAGIVASFSSFTSGGESTASLVLPVSPVVM